MQDKKGYVRLGDDSEAKSLLSDLDELSDDDFYVQHNDTILDSKPQITRDVPPSYEEAARQSASLTEIEVLIPSNKKNFDVTVA